MSVDHGTKCEANETFPHLASAPIVEAVLHWQARATTWPERNALARSLLDRLTDYPDCRPQHLFEFAAQVAGESSPTPIHRETWDGFRLISEDHRQIVQISRDGLVFSRLAPYENWDSFAAEGCRLWQVYRELAHPLEVQRLGTRFINRISLSQPADVGNYLASPTLCLEAAELPTVGFLYQSRHAVPGGRFEINVVRTIQCPDPSSEEVYHLIADIDVGTTQEMPCDDTVLEAALGELRRWKNKVFFHLFLDPALEQFRRSRG